MKHNIKFVYFDIGGVLMRYTGVIDRLSVLSNKKREYVKEIYHKHEEIYLRGIASPQEKWIKISQHLGLDKNIISDFRLFSVNEFKPIRESHEFVLNLAKHYPIGILSNISHGYYDLLLKQKLIPHHNYSVVIESCKIGMIKPEKEIYEHAKKLAKVSHDSILFIDDLEENIEAAEKLGWDTVHFNTDHPNDSIKEIKGKLKLSLG